MTKSLYKQMLLLLLAAATGTSYSQELNLFQAVENTGDEQENSRRPVRSQQANQGPAFTLVGTSRFGDKFLASLLARDGQAVTVEWKKNTAVEIKGYNGYSVVDVGARTATLNFPDNDPCVEDEEKGVKCNGSYTLLNLSTGTPLEQLSEPIQDNSAEILDQPEDEVVAGVEISEDGTRVFRNPFSGQIQELPQLTPEEQAARDERRQRRAELFRNFEIVRIPDDEIPEGMQRVRTPFGDSLEPLEE